MAWSINRYLKAFLKNPLIPTSLGTAMQQPEFVLCFKFTYACDDRTLSLFKENVFNLLLSENKITPEIVQNMNSWEHSVEQAVP